MHMRITFVSNYINHHQIPFCKAMCRYAQVDFTFIQTQPMEEERIRMGWQLPEGLHFLKLYYEEPQVCRDLIMDSEIVLFGGCEDESYIEKRLEAGKPVIRLSERLYKGGQWKAISPRGLRKKYHDHVRYRKAQVYLLCYGAYVPDDFHIIRAYPGKMYRWGYFPETKTYDVDKLMAGKGYGKDKKLSIMWAARMIELKHPELAIKTAHYLKSSGIDFHLNMVGGGELEQQMRELARTLKVEDCVSFTGFCAPQKVREMMEQTNIFLMTSNRIEGWGVVINEAMNSGCAVVASHIIGSVPYLIRNGENGLIYKEKKEKQLFIQTARLAGDRALCERLGREAYRTIVEEWNPENAADCLMELLAELKLLEMSESAGTAAGGSGKASGGAEEAAYSADRTGIRTATGPCSPTPVIPERKMYQYLMKEKQSCSKHH